MEKMTKKEKREMIAAAMKTISEQEGLTPDARARGLAILQQAFEKKIESK
jgi:hypothetical protein